MKPANELLYDSEASLRLVDRAIGDLGTARQESERVRIPLRQHLEMTRPGDNVDALLDDYANTAAIVVRFCQTAGMLDAAGSEALGETPRYLRDASLKADAATVGILDGLARAVALVDSVDGRLGASDVKRHEIAASIREELNGIADHLHFQDLATQQLSDIEALFADMRRRITGVISIFTPPGSPSAMSAGEFSADVEMKTPVRADAIVSRNAH